jgi:hypothetical protein
MWLGKWSSFWREAGEVEGGNIEVIAAIYTWADYREAA